MNGPQAFQLQEMISYCQAQGITRRHEMFQIIDILQAMDRRYLQLTRDNESNG